MTVRATRPAAQEWVAGGCYEGRTSASFLDECAARAPGALAVVEGRVRLDYGALSARAVRLAGHLSGHLSGSGLGVVAPGDVVTFQLPNWWEATVVYQALSRLGAVVNPVVPIYRERELSFILRQAAPSAVVIPHRFRGFDYVEMLQRIVRGLAAPPLVTVVRPEGELPEGFVGLDLSAPQLTAPLDGPPPSPVGTGSDVCLLLYTSGTTADPKGVLHSHDTLVYEVRSIIDLCGLGGDDAVFMPSPVTHITGFLFGLLSPSVVGAAVSLLDRFEPGAAVDVIEADACRFTMAATPFLHGLVEEYDRRGRHSSLRHFLCGGADVPPPLVRQAAEVLGCHVCRVYGSSEFPTFACGRPGEGPEVNADTDGLPIEPAQGRLDAGAGSGSPGDEGEGAGGAGGAGAGGELLVRGPELFLGYLDPTLNDAAFTPDGYFRTGDLASIDGRGSVTIRGRRKDIIVRGGENVSAKEVEELLVGHPAVRDVAVVAMPDPVMVERACAFVVCRPGETVTLDALVTFLDGLHLARQKYPERVEIVDELPMTASGKVQKFVLRDRIRAILEAEGADGGRSGVPGAAGPAVDDRDAVGAARPPAAP